MVGTISSLAASRMTISHTPNHVIARRMVGTISSLAASRMTIQVYASSSASILCIASSSNLWMF